MDALANAARLKLPELQLQSMANSVWESTTLKLSEGPPFAAMTARACAVISSLVVDVSSGWRHVMEQLTGVLALVFALSTTGMLSPTVLAEIAKAGDRGARYLDELAMETSVDLEVLLPRHSREREPEPGLVRLGSLGLVVLFKPAGWTVAVGGNENLHERMPQLRGGSAGITSSAE